MNWKKIIKDKSRQPSTGAYSDWKEQIAEECYFQCVYCSIHESQFGGIDHYHIEHYKPKSIPEFKILENDILNLFYACPICNRFKSKDWPNNEDDLNIICYPDPSKHNYLDLFSIDLDTYKLIGRYISSCYLTERLFLNRPQLIYERREQILKDREKTAITEINKLKQNEIIKNDIESINKLYDITSNLLNTIRKRDKIRPYKLAEIRK